MNSMENWHWGLRRYTDMSTSSRCSGGDRSNLALCHCHWKLPGAWNRSQMLSLWHLRASSGNWCPQSHWVLTAWIRHWFFTEDDKYRNSFICHHIHTHRSWLQFTWREEWGNGGGGRTGTWTGSPLITVICKGTVHSCCQKVPVVAFKFWFLQLKCTLTSLFCFCSLELFCLCSCENVHTVVPSTVPRSWYNFL